MSINDQDVNKPKTETAFPDLNVDLPDRYQTPEVVEVFELEALAVVCTDTNAKNDVAIGCNPGALFS